MFDRSLAAKIVAAIAAAHADRIELRGRAIDQRSVGTIVDILGGIDASLRVTLAAQLPLARADLRSLHRVGVAELRIAGAPCAADLIVALRECEALGVAVRYDLPPALRSTAALPLLSHLGPPAIDSGEPREQLFAPLIDRWRTHRCSGLLVRLRRPDHLRIIDSREMSWRGTANARPRRMELRGASSQVYLACDQAPTLGELERLLPQLPRPALTDTLTSLVAAQVVLDLDGRFVALAVDAPPWWTPRPVEAREPHPPAAPLGAAIWEPVLGAVPWTPRRSMPPQRAQPRRLPVLDARTITDGDSL